MAFGAALIAQGAGQAQGRVQAYKDQVAAAADMTRLNQQQAQFDAEQKQQASQYASTQQQRGSEFSQQQAIRTAQEGRAAANAQRTNDQWKPADPATKFSGGYLWQQAQQNLKAGGLANSKSALANTGAGLVNTAQALDNQWAPILNNLKAITAQQNITNNVGNDAASAHQYALDLQTHASELQQGLYAYKAKINTSVGGDPKSVAKEYDAAQKGVEAALKGLDTKGADALGKSVNLVSPQARQAASAKAAEIQAAPDPFAAADAAISSMPKDGGSPFIADYLAEVARAAYIQRKMLGAKPPAAAIPETPPFGLQLNGLQPRPFGASVGGSNAATPFGQ